MSGIGTGYDLSCTTYSPDGKIFQVEYAMKAVDNSGTAIGVRVKDGIVLGVEKLITLKMLEPGSNKRIYTLDKHIGLTFAGLSADARHLVNRGKLESKNYKSFYDHSMSVRILNERLSGYMQAYTLYASVRPFGCSIILGGYDSRGPQLYMIEPSGISYGYYAIAVGKAKQAAKGELEKLKLSEMICRQAIEEVAKIIYQVHDDVKDKEFELEMSWICEESKYKHENIPKDLLKQIEEKVKKDLETEMQE
jgi:20S proteasome subunit alpha 7